MFEQQNKAANHISLTDQNIGIIENDFVLIDITMLYEISSGDEKFVHTMVQTFLKHMPETLFKLEQGLKDQDWQSVYRAAHSAKSSLSIIKIDEMSEWILQAETNAKDEVNLDIIPDLVEKIRQKFSFAERMLNEKFPAE